MHLIHLQDELFGVGKNKKSIERAAPFHLLRVRTPPSRPVPVSPSRPPSKLGQRARQRSYVTGIKTVGANDNGRGGTTPETALSISRCALSRGYAPIVIVIVPTRCNFIILGRR